MGPHRHPVPATPGSFPLDTGCIEVWSSYAVALRLDIDVTVWNVMLSQGFALDRHCSREYVRRVAVIMKLLYLSMMGLQALSPENGTCAILRRLLPEVQVELLSLRWASPDGATLPLLATAWTTCCTGHLFALPLHASFRHRVRGVTKGMLPTGAHAPGVCHHCCRRIPL